MILSALRKLLLNILPKVYVEQALIIVDSKKITDINEHFPQASESLEDLQVIVCTKFKKYNFNSILESI